jgi:hypothetical protein
VSGFLNIIKNDQGPARSFGDWIGLVPDGPVQYKKETETSMLDNQHDPCTLEEEGSQCIVPINKGQISTSGIVMYLLESLCLWIFPIPKGQSSSMTNK